MVRSVGTTRSPVLPGSRWRARAAAHAARVDAFVAPHLARRRDGQAHPVHDFLFTYYSQRPAQLRRWHPGYGVALADAEERVDWKGYAAVGSTATVSPEHLLTQTSLVESTAALLSATAGRPANFGCFGLHEWAMVHRLGEDTTRHPDWPLRLGPDGTDRVVESHRVACSHFDAFRFFTPSARPLNVLQPGAADRASYEQPACLHANMDLYKHAFRLTPLVPSELVADCFELAWDVRVLDMRASPYDMTGLILDPAGDEWTSVKIETPEGKREYQEHQRRFAERSSPLRRRLIEECQRLLGATSD